MPEDDEQRKDDDKARAREQALEKAREKAKERAAAKKQQGTDDDKGAKKAAAAKSGKSGKTGKAAKGKDEDEGPPPIPDVYKGLLDGLKRAFPDQDLAPEFNPQDRYLYLTVPAARLPDVAAHLRDEADLNYLRCLSGVDYRDRLQVVYHLTRIAPEAEQQPFLVAMCVDADREQPVVPSVVPVWPTADFHEREAFDMFGIRFEGHPNLRPILLPDHWQGGYPLRKDFVDKRPKKQRKVRPR